MMTEQPPELDPEPELEDPPGTEVGAYVGFDNEDERASMRPVDPEPQYGSGPTYSGYDEMWTDPYRSLGGLTRPDAYFGAIEFDCPPPEQKGCGAKGRTLDVDGEKCRVWVERTEKWHTRKMPCLARIRLAKEKGIL